MTTPVQILANCRSAIRSTGPRSDAAKSTVSQNAAKHALSAASPVLASEDRGAFDALVESPRSEFPPHGEHEQFLVQQMAEARGRVSRVRLIEATAFHLLLGSETTQTPYSRIAEAMIGRGSDRFRGAAQEAAGGCPIQAERRFARNIPSSARLPNKANPAPPLGQMR